MSFLLLTTFGDIAEYALYILIAVLVLLVMITVHEFGHYLAGKIFGFGIEEFAIGFGPKIISKTKKNGERFSVRIFPLGGFCAFKGEDEDDPDPSAFNNKKPYQRIIVLIAGAFMNYVTAILVICLMFGIYGYSAIMTYKTENPPSSAEYALQDGDVILTAEGKNIYLVTDLMSVISGKNSGETVEMYILRQGSFRTISVTLQSDGDISSVEDLSALSSALGVKYSETESGYDSGFRTTGIKLGFFKTVGKSFEYSFKLASTIFTVFRQLFTGSIGLKSMGGTVTTITVTADAIRNGGLWSFLNITAFIGVNLAVFNLIPFPALDGSRVVFTLIEWITKKPLKRKVEGIIHLVGLAIILVFAVVFDLQQCF